MSEGNFSLSSCQSDFINKFSKKHNIILSAPAGSGKSFILNYIKSLDLYKDQFEYGKIIYTSSTAISALLIDACTIHSFLGIGLGKGNYKDWLRFSNRPAIRQRGEYLKYVEALVIDEFSMLSSEFIENTDMFLRMKRNKYNQAFGGVQLILIGDIFQLGAVEGSDISNSKLFSDKGYNWSYITFNKIFRQDKSDLEFINLLNSIKFNTLSKDCDALKIITKMNKLPDNLEDYTILVSTNEEVNKYNSKMMERLSITDLKEYKPRLVKKGVKGLESVFIGVGCKIIITYNISKILCNGRACIVVKTNENDLEVILAKSKKPDISSIEDNAYDEDEFHIIPYIDKVENEMCMCDGVYKVKQKKLYSYLPVKIGYATTIHKSQGSTLDNVIINVNRIFDIYQFYVAVSRVRKMQDIILLGNLENIFYLMTKEKTKEMCLAKKKFFSKFIIDKYITRLITLQE